MRSLNFVPFIVCSVKPARDPKLEFSSSERFSFREQANQLPS